MSDVASTLRKSCDLLGIDIETDYLKAASQERSRKRQANVTKPNNCDNGTPFCITGQKYIDFSGWEFGHWGSEFSRFKRNRFGLLKCSLYRASAALSSGH
jgi:hypothetical protein